MRFTKKTVGLLFALVAFGVVLLVGLLKLPAVLQFFGLLFGLLSPLLLGICIAFILNVPMRSIETRLFAPLTRRFTGRIWKRLRRPLALVLTLVLAAGVLALALFLIIPELARTLGVLADSIPGFIARVEESANDLAARYPQWQDWLASLEINWDSIANSLISFVQNGAVNLFSSTLNLATSVFNGVFNFVLAFIFALYILLGKETLGRQLIRLCRAHLPDKHTDRILRVASLANKTFSRFITGQCLEAVILGLMFYLAMLIFRFPYALMIAVLIAILALIPIFGAFIGCIIGAFLIFVNDPMQAFWFIVMFLVLQQIEGNLIYPKVVGTSVGLPSIWVLAAVTVGGGLFGIFGMLTFVPLCSVLYALLRESTARKLLRREARSKGAPAAPSSPPPSPRRKSPLCGRMSGAGPVHNLYQTPSIAVRNPPGLTFRPTTGGHTLYAYTGNPGRPGRGTACSSPGAGPSRIGAGSSFPAGGFGAEAGRPFLCSRPELLQAVLDLFHRLLCRCRDRNHLVPDCPFQIRIPSGAHLRSLQSGLRLRCAGPYRRAALAVQKAGSVDFSGQCGTGQRCGIPVQLGTGNRVRHPVLAVRRHALQSQRADQSAVRRLLGTAGPHLGQGALSPPVPSD